MSHDIRKAWSVMLAGVESKAGHHSHHQAATLPSRGSPHLRPVRDQCLDGRRNGVVPGTGCSTEVVILDLDRQDMLAHEGDHRVTSLEVSVAGSQVENVVAVSCRYGHDCPFVRGEARSPKVSRKERLRIFPLGFLGS